MERAQGVLPALRAMAFNGGDLCDGTPRSAKVYFECGDEDRLVTVSEPATCVYAARFETPSACSAASVASLHEELQAAAAAAGLPYEPDPAVKQLLKL